MYNILWWEIFNIDPEILIAMVRSYPLHLQEPDPGRWFVAPIISAIRPGRLPSLRTCAWAVFFFRGRPDGQPIFHWGIKEVFAIDDEWMMNGWLEDDWVSSFSSSKSTVTMKLPVIFVAIQAIASCLSFPQKLVSGSSSGWSVGLLTMHQTRWAGHCWRSLVAVCSFKAPWD